MAACFGVCSIDSWLSPGKPMIQKVPGTMQRLTISPMAIGIESIRKSVLMRS